MENDYKLFIERNLLKYFLLNKFGFVVKIELPLQRF